jgi:GNAT superfamily N-acetyltransferase
MKHTVRRLLDYEYSKYREHLKKLDDNSRHLRFGLLIKDESIDQLCNGIEADREHHILFGIENKDLELVAVGHIALDDRMELAFSVLKEYQGQGMGSDLMKRCIQWCRTHAILEGMMVCLSHNSVIKHLCTKYGIHMTSEHGETLADIHLDPAEPGTYLEEAVDRNAAILDYIAKRAFMPRRQLITQ